MTNPRAAGPRVWYVPADVLMPARGSGTPGPAPEIKVIEHSAYEDIVQKYENSVLKYSRVVDKYTALMDEAWALASVLDDIWTEYGLTEKQIAMLTRFREFIKQNGLGEK